MNDPAVRHAVPRDAEAMCAIYNAAVSERSSTFETNPRSAADFETRIEDSRFDGAWRDVLVVERLLAASSP
jgi:L-amino acid N-acyltransferase YncA